MLTRQGYPRRCICQTKLLGSRAFLCTAFSMQPATQVKLPGPTQKVSSLAEYRKGATWRDRSVPSAPVGHHDVVTNSTDEGISVIELGCLSGWRVHGQQSGTHHYNELPLAGRNFSGLLLVRNVTSIVRPLRLPNNAICAGPLKQLLGCFAENVNHHDDTNFQ